MSIKRERTALIETDGDFLREWREELLSWRTFLARLAGSLTASPGGKATDSAVVDLNQGRKA